MSNFTVSTFTKQDPAHWSTAGRWHRFHQKQTRSFWLCIFPMILHIFWVLILICFISSAIVWVWGFFLREAVKPKHFQSIFHTGVNYHKLYPITNRLRRHSDRFHSYSSFHPCSSQRPLSKQPLQAVFFWKDSSCHYGAAGLSAHYNTAAPLCISPRGWVPQPVRNAGGFR